MTLYKCTDCQQEKPFELMKKYRGKASVRCLKCENIKRNIQDAARKAKEKELLEMEKERIEAEQEELKKLIAPPRSFIFKPYMSEKVWVRNNGNVHIKSRGFHC